MNAVLSHFHIKSDLEENAAQYAECVYLRKVKDGVAKFHKRASAPKHGELVAIKTGQLTLRIRKR